VVITVFVILTAVPLTRILNRTGFNMWWCILLYVPILNLVGLWFFAYAEWPAIDGPSR
jgi:hypothetical protein